MLRLRFEGIDTISQFGNKKYIKKANDAIDIIINDLPDNKQKKAYFIKNDRSFTNWDRVKEALFFLFPILQIQDIGDDRLPANQYLDLTSHYSGFTFYKDENDFLVWTAIADFRSQQHSDYPDGELYLAFLVGKGGAYLIFELLKNLIERKVKSDMVDISKFKYIDLTALTSYNTLNFYSKQNGIIKKVDFKKYLKDINRILKSLSLSEKKKLKRMLDIEDFFLKFGNKEQKREKEMEIIKFWDEHINQKMHLVHFFFFFNTKISQRNKNIISDKWNKAQPIKDLEKETKKLNI
jgi:hypothetical protein